MRRLVIGLVLTTLLAFTTNAQDVWQNHFQSAELEINYKKVECHDPANGIHKSILSLQFVNLTSNPVSVHFDKEYWHGNKCFGCDRSDEYHFVIELAPNQTLFGSCEDKRNKALYIFDKMLNAKSSSLSKFELVNVEVVKK